MRRILVVILLLCGMRSSHAQAVSDCTRAFAYLDLDINNVRARIMAGGDLWTSLTNPHYEIPKGGGAHSIFCGSFWLGALDGANNLYVSADHYYSETDFYPGPLDTLGGGTNDSTCTWFDQLWKLNRTEVEAFIANRADPNYVVPDAIRTWPGNGNPMGNGFSRTLAPFVDVDGDGVYNYLNGDYPAFNFSGQNDCRNDLLGDQMIWWVFNDNGPHQTTNGVAMRVEVQAMAFAYSSSNDKLNDATFYRYKLINRSAVNYHDVWFGQFVDYDLGSAFDDYVGCDVGRGLGYVYNGDVNDGSSALPGADTYGAHPPATGIDFLEGPLADQGDGIDNDHDLVIDEPGERIALTTSVYYESDFSVRGDPQNAAEYYQYLKARWRDDTPITYGGNGYGGSLPCRYMFPGDSDPLGFGTGGIPAPPWYESGIPFDRLQLNSVGPFSFEAGEVELITIGVPWARDMNGNNLDAVERLKEADDYIQQLFDNCFAIPCVDQAPAEITYTQDDILVSFNLLGAGTAWNWDFGDGQTSTDHYPSHYYTNPGDYTVCVSVTTPCGTLTDCDTVHISDKLKDCGPEITRIEGKGNGNCVMDLKQETIDEILSSPDQRALFPVYQSMHGPVKISYEDYDALQDGDYRIAFDSVTFAAHWKMWRVGGTDTVYSDSTIGSGNLQRIAMWGLGVQVQQVYKPGLQSNPDRNGYLTSSITFSNPSRNWLSGVQDNDLNTQENWIRAGSKSGTGVCVADFNDRFFGVNGIDEDENFENVCAGTWGPYRLCAYAPTITQSNICYPKGPAWNPPISSAIMNKFENIANVDVVITADRSKWTRCCVIETGPTYLMNEAQREPFHLRAGLSVDKNGKNINNGGISDPNNPEAADYIGATGMGWFPGYAINLETGERLNLAFGENSTLSADNGRDMLWNPRENRFFSSEGWLWGGCHYIYVFGHNGDDVFTTGPLAGQLKDIPRYDAGRAMYTILNSDITANPELREVYADAMWTTIPVLNPGHSLLECDVTVKLRVQKPYAQYQTDSVPQNNNNPLYGFRIEKQNLCCNGYTGDVSVYPNPFADECNIQFENTHEHTATLKLYDVQGRLVREYNTTADKIVISGAGLFSGMYIWTLQVDGEEPQTGKIILR